MTQSLSERVVIIGSGQAGGELAASLRMSGHVGAITIVGDEPHLPYSRPPLSKAYLFGTTTVDDMLLRHPNIYVEQNITVRSGEVVTSIDRANQQIVIGHSERLEYDRLVLATGGRPRQLPAPELAGARNVLSLRTIRDAENLRDRLTDGARVAIIGGGYIGLEIASAARMRGCSVTLLEVGPRVLGRVTAPPISEFFHALHREEGVNLILDAEISGFVVDSDGDFTAVQMSDGQRIEADFLLVGIGLLPRTELAEAAGLHVENGIIVDEMLATEDPHIFAIGDVARHPDPQHGGLRRLESVPNASEQARVVASVITGNPVPYSAVPWFWSDQFDVKLQVVGLSASYDRLIIRQDPDKLRQITALYLQGDRIISADVTNKPAEFALLRKLIAAGTPVDPDALENPATPIKECVRESLRSR